MPSRMELANRYGCYFEVWPRDVNVERPPGVDLSSLCLPAALLSCVLASAELSACVHGYEWGP